MSSAENCERCEGDGSYRELAPCTTNDTDCACNGPRVLVDPCPDCNGSGYRSVPDHEAERARRAEFDFRHDDPFEVRS